MSSRLSLIIAASAIGLEIGVITPGINAGFIIMAVITCFVSPVVFNWLSQGSVLKSKKTIIIGGSSTAVVLVRRLMMHGEKAIIVEVDKNRAEEIQAKGMHCIEGDGANPELYKKMNLNHSDIVVVETGLDDVNYEVCRVLRNELKHDNIITRAGVSAIELKLKRLGIETVDVIGVLATTIENLILRPTTYHALIESLENFSVEEVLITNKNMDGLQVKEVPFHKDAILIMVKRKNNFYIPHGDTYFRTGDILHVFGTNTAIEDTREKLD